MPVATSAPPPPAPPANPLTESRFAELLRNQPTSLSAYFKEVGAKTTVGSTQITAHCHFMRLDGTGTPRFKDLADRLARELINYAIPRSKIEKATGAATGTGDAKQFAALYREANRLFADVAKSGEGGELLLYLLTEACLQIPQLFCKMPLKTNPQVHYHGADGIHGSVDPSTGSLRLHWGESKLYATPKAAINSALKSIAPFLLPSGGSTSPQARDVQLLRDNIDLTDPALEAAILKYLDPDDECYNKLTYRGIVLAGFDSSSYSTATVTEATIEAAIAASISGWHTHAGKRCTKHKLASVGIDLFCIPFPSVDKFRKSFMEELGLK